MCAISLRLCGVCPHLSCLASFRRGQRSASTSRVEKCLAQPSRCAVLALLRGDSISSLPASASPRTPTKRDRCNAYHNPLLFDAPLIAADQLRKSAAAQTHGSCGQGRRRAGRQRARDRFSPPQARRASRPARGRRSGVRHRPPQPQVIREGTHRRIDRSMHSIAPCNSASIMRTPFSRGACGAKPCCQAAVEPRSVPESGLEVACGQTQ